MGKQLVFFISIFLIIIFFSYLFVLVFRDDRLYMASPNAIIMSILASFILTPHSKIKAGLAFPSNEGVFYPSHRMMGMLFCLEQFVKFLIALR